MLVEGDDRALRVRLLIAGADDVLARMFHKDELTARLQAIIRRSRGHARSVIRTGRLALDLAARTVEIDGKPLNVTPKEYGILELLSLRRGRTLTKEMFLDHLYGGMDEPEQKIVDVFICKLRKKIAKLTGEADIPIQTVWGQGYTLREPMAGLAEDRGRLRLRRRRIRAAETARRSRRARDAAAAAPPHRLTVPSHRPGRRFQHQLGSHARPVARGAARRSGSSRPLAGMLVPVPPCCPQEPTRLPRRSIIADGKPCGALPHENNLLTI